MKAPAFWARPPGVRAWLLSPVAARVGAITAARMAELGEDAGLPVFCVGNFVAGGAGKTPTAIWLARRLSAAGERPWIVSRGYGGVLGGPVAVDLDRHQATDVGDEPLLQARAAPTIVARDRVAGAKAAKEAGASVVVLDDGLQNPSLAKTFTLAVVDGGFGVGNGRCLPAGPLRAPLDAQIGHVDAVLTIGAGAAGEAVAGAAGKAAKPTFSARLAPNPTVVAALAGRRLAAVAGLGRPQKFVDTLTEAGADVVRLHALADHAAPTAREAATILAGAARDGLAIVTTEKDAVKWRVAAPDLLAAATVLPITLEVADEAALLELIRRRIADR